MKLYKIKKYIDNPKLILINLVNKGFFNWMQDKKFLEFSFKLRMNKELELENPKTYNEKLQWLKLYDRNPLYTKLVDKYEVKNYVANKIGGEYVIPTIGVWDDFEQINFDNSPEQFVLKVTHDSGGLVICKNKIEFSKDEAKKKINKALKNNYFYSGREWPYKNIKPRIIMEKYMVDKNGELNDYKFFVFNGKVKMLFIATDRQAETETCFDFFDEKFNHLNFINGHPNSTRKFEKPDKFDEMIRLAEILAKDFPHARIDFYNVDGKIYFGEITFFHWSGLVPFEPEIWDYKIGEWLDLPEEESTDNEK